MQINWKDRNLDFYVPVNSPTGFELHGIEIRKAKTFVDSFCCLFLNSHSMIPIKCNINATDLEVFELNV